MTQQPDKLFRDKLEDYRRPAPASAWEKIAAAQQKNSRKVLWMKVAASLLFVAVAAYLLWPARPTEVEQRNQLAIASDQGRAEIKSPADTEPQADPEVASVPESDAQRTAPIADRKTRPKTVVNHQTESAVSLATSKAPEEIVERKDQTASLDIPHEPVATVATSEILVEPNAESAPQNITLVFTAKEVNEYLHKNVLAQATPDVKKPSTLMKLLKKANDLKNNQNPIGELRQKKNEILALNFKNEKQRGQNK